MAMRRFFLSLSLCYYCWFHLVLLSSLSSTLPAVSSSRSSNDDDQDVIGSNVEPHPDPNEEDYPNMIYIGKLDHDTGRRLSMDHDNRIKFMFGTSFDDSHKELEDTILHTHDHFGILPEHHEDLANRGHATKTREEVLRERRHKPVPEQPKPYGHVDVDEVDGGVTPVKLVAVEPFFLDVAPVTNKEFAKFVSSTYYETEAEKFGWSFVLQSFLSSKQQQTDGNSDQDTVLHQEIDPEAEHWVVVQGAYWRQPEGPGSSYKYREHHPVTHVSHRDAAEYCEWLGKRLPGEWEWEAAARAGYWAPSNRTVYAWGDEPDMQVASKYANLWQGKFPFENTALDGWRGTSPVTTYPPNALGFYDMTGNVWEWMRGGKHKARIVRGGSYVDTLDGSYNHAATLGARSTIHATTTTGNVGFRCAKSPKKRVEHHWTWHDEDEHGQLAVEDSFGKRDMIPQRNWEDRFNPDDDDDEEEQQEDVPKPKKKKVVKKYERYSTEL